MVMMMCRGAIKICTHCYVEILSEGKKVGEIGKIDTMEEKIAQRRKEKKQPTMKLDFFVASAWEKKLFLLRKSL